MLGRPLEAGLDTLPHSPSVPPGYQIKVLTCWQCDFLSRAVWFPLTPLNLRTVSGSVEMLFISSTRYFVNRCREHKGRHQWKKNVFFRALPESPKPPPWPQFGQLVPFFSEVKIQDLKVSLQLKILYILYNILYICNLKNSYKFNTLAFLKK